MLRSRHRAVLATATAATVVSLVSGCGEPIAGSMAQNVENVATGSSAETGSMLVRNAFVLGPPPDAQIPQGGRAAVYLTLFNRAPGPGPTGVRIDESPSPAPDRLIEASVGQTARSVEINGGPIEVPPDQLVAVTSGEGRLVLRGLTRPLSGGESVRLTLMFERSGKVTFSVPVLTRTGSYATLSPFPTSPSPEPTGTASPVASPETPSPESPSPESPSPGGAATATEDATPSPGE